MKPFKTEVRSFVLLIVIALSSQLVASAEEKFSISKDRKSAKAIVSASKEFTVTFDPPLASELKEYTPSRSFTLTVGLCRMEISAGKMELEGKDVVILKIKDPSVNSNFPTTNNPAGFKITSDEVKFDGAIPNCLGKDNIKFEPYPADANKFLVEVSLDGNFSASLGLKSEDASLYVEPEKDSNKEILPLWAWIIIGVGSFLFLILLITAIAVPVYIKRRKQKITQQSDPTLQTAIEKAKSKDRAKSASEESKKLDRKEHAPVKQAKANKVESKQNIEQPVKPKDGKRSAENLVIANNDKQSIEKSVSKISQAPQQVLVQPDKKVPRKQSSVIKTQPTQEPTQTTQEPSVIEKPTTEPSVTEEDPKNHDDLCFFKDKPMNAPERKGWLCRCPYKDAD